jgi:putative DNA primase/helicase
MNPDQAIFQRPGVSDAFLLSADCAHIGDDECIQRYGFFAAGIAIPFRSVTGSPIMVNDRPFARVRLYDETENQKYSQRAGSGVHIYVPPNFKTLPRHSTLIVVEGEFKAAALGEAGYAALGMCGITGAVSTLTRADGERIHRLNKELVELLEFHQPASVVFLGDADVVLNAQFAVEAAKLRKLICETKRFVFVKRVAVAKPPLDGPKGVDDCRQHYGSDFEAWFDGLLGNEYEVPPKVTAVEVFGALLRQEAEQLKTLLKAEGHEGSRARFRLLQSAAQLWHEPAAKLELSALLCGLLGVTKTELSGLVKDATNHRESNQSGKTSHDDQQKDGTQDPDLEPWPEPVDGASLLDEVRASYNGIMALPAEADVLVTVWTQHTYVFDCFPYTPYLHVTSADGQCGKSTLADLMARLCFNTPEPGSMSAAAMYRRIERIKPCLLLDDWDSMTEDKRQGAINALNTGFKTNGVYTICVSNGQDYDDRDFHTFCPKAIFGLATAKLPSTTRSRCFSFMLQPKLPTERLKKLRHFDGVTLRRKMLRWANDNRNKLKNANPTMPTKLTSRQEDIAEPLLAIADACGGHWPGTIRRCIVHLFKAAKTHEASLAVELLKDARNLFAYRKAEHLLSQEFCKELAALEERPWAAFGRRQEPITVYQLAELLRENFGIRSRQIRLTPEEQRRLAKAGEDYEPGLPPRNKTKSTNLRGYHLEDFQVAFAHHLPLDDGSGCYAATTPENKGDSSNSQVATEESCSDPENAANASKIRGCSSVADQTTENGERELETADEMVL